MVGLCIEKKLCTPNLPAFKLSPEHKFVDPYETPSGALVPFRLSQAPKFSSLVEESCFEGQRQCDVSSRVVQIFKTQSSETLSSNSIRSFMTSLVPKLWLLPLAQGAGHAPGPHAQAPIIAYSSREVTFPVIHHGRSHSFQGRAANAFFG